MNEEINEDMTGDMLEDRNEAENEEQTLKMTELDYQTAVPHLQMIKAALPYINVSEQRFVSLFVKASELQHTMRLFDGKEEGSVGICSLEADSPSTPLDMLNAMKPYGSQADQEFIDLIINFFESSKIYQSYRDATENWEELHAAEQPSTFIPGRQPAGSPGGMNNGGNMNYTGGTNNPGNPNSSGNRNNSGSTNNSGSMNRNFNQRSNSRNSQNQQQQQRQRQEDSRHRNDARHLPLDQIKNMLPPDQQSRLETAQLLMQTFQQFS